MLGIGGVCRMLYVVAVSNRLIAAPIGTRLYRRKPIGQLVYFDVAYNAFTGTLPVSVGQWTNLVEFSVASNVLSGSLPSDLKNIATVNVADNSFTGSIPNDVCSAVNLPSIEADCSELSCSCCSVCHYG
jgi:hypothetical protein